MVMKLQSTNKKALHITAIETSCDETAIAIIEVSGRERSFRVLSNIVLSQVAMHAEWGGVVPNLAKREHEKNLPVVLLKAIQESNFSISPPKADKPRADKLQILNSILEKNEELRNQFQKHILLLKKPAIDLIAVTQGPGLEPALWVGVNFARALSVLWDIPLVGINHMEGHILSALIKQKEISPPKISKSKIKNSLSAKTYTLNPVCCPALALLVSGGHTELVLIRKPLQYKIIGETRDDAAGEAFDKVARILDLGYPGGPAISREASLVPRHPDQLEYPVFKLPRPMMHTKDYDFSFSGLKTAVLYLVRDLEKQGENIKNVRPMIAKEFQDAIVDVLVTKTIRAAKEYKVKMVLLGGGVAANKELQRRLSEEIQKNCPKSYFWCPTSDLTGDNALMMAVAALFRSKKASKTIWKTLKPDGNMRL